MENNVSLDSLLDEAKSSGIREFTVRAIIPRSSQRPRQSGVLFLKRANNVSRPGKYQPPGGKLERNEGLIDALKREIREETGRRISRINNYLTHKDYVANGTLYREFYFEVELDVERFHDMSTDIILPDGVEHDDFTWAYKDKAANLNISKSYLNILHNYFWKPS